MTLLAHTDGWSVWSLVTVAAAGYLILADRRRRDPRSWNAWRSAAFVAGCALVGIALTPQLLPFPDGDLRAHMLQHLLIGMVAPLGLVLAAPITLVLRSVDPRHGRRIVRARRSRPVHLLANPVTALSLNVGSLVLLYCTPLYVATTGNAALHDAVHLHFLAAGCLFTWVIAGPDPAPRRPSVPARLVVLGVAIAVHASLAQLLYAGLYVQVPASADELRGAAAVMYYGGDVAELLLAFALVTTWRPRRTAPPANRAARMARSTG
jgi:putative membrane protein